MPDPVVDSHYLKVATSILQGLLASGHYTRPENDVESVGILRVDNGEDWKGIYACKNSAMAIEDALKLTNEFLKQLNLDFSNKDS